MKIGIGVWGSCLRFKDYTERWSGQSEYSAFVRMMLNRKDVEKIYLIGKHDDHWNSFEMNTQKLVPFGSKVPKLDIAFVFQSQGAACISTIPGYRWVPATKTEPYRRTKVLAMAENYAAPITRFLNESKVPWVYLATDVRYIDMIKPADLSNHPALVLSNCDAKIEKWKHITKFLPFEDSADLEYKTWIDTPVHYAGLEKLNLVTLHDREQNRRKTVLFAVVCNQILNYDYRARQLTAWLPNETYIYGSIDPETLGNRFPVQFVPSAELDKIFSRVKYTLVLPIYDHGYGKKWLTFKPYEMIRLGVIPFLHPDYDQDYRFVGPEHYIRVSSPADMNQKIKELERDPKFKAELLEKLNTKLTPPNDIFKTMKECIKREIISDHQKALIKLL